MSASQSTLDPSPLYKTEKNWLLPIPEALTMVELCFYYKWYFSSSSDFLPPVQCYVSHPVSTQDTITQFIISPLAKRSTVSITAIFMGAM